MTVDVCHVLFNRTVLRQQHFLFAEALILPKKYKSQFTWCECSPKIYFKNCSMMCSHSGFRLLHIWQNTVQASASWVRVPAHWLWHEWNSMNVCAWLAGDLCNEKCHTNPSALPCSDNLLNVCSTPSLFLRIKLNCSMCMYCNIKGMQMLSLEYESTDFDCTSIIE